MYFWSIISIAWNIICKVDNLLPITCKGNFLIGCVLFNHYAAWQALLVRQIFKLRQNVLMPVSEIISWLRTFANITQTLQIDRIVRIVRIEIIFWDCKKNSHRLILGCRNHLYTCSRDLSYERRHRETSLSRRLNSAAQVSAMAVVLRWNRIFGERGKTLGKYKKEPSTTYLKPFSTS